MRAGIALGSNLGDSHAHLTRAVEILKRMHKGMEEDFLCSSFVTTEPQDCPPDSPRFLNAVVELETPVDPLTLLKHLQGVEIAAGRPAGHAFHAPRTLDLDLLYCDEMTLQSPELQLPHPRITERLFVLQPLAEIRPSLRLPGWQDSCQDILLRFSNKQYHTIID